MSVIDTLITNRTGGYYGIDDLNRVGDAMYYIAERLRSCGLDITVDPRTDWVLTDQVNVSTANLYLRNLQKIRDALTLFVTTPDVPDGESHFNAKEANDIEKILIDVEQLITNMIETLDAGWALASAYTGLYAKEATT